MNGKVTIYVACHNKFILPKNLDTSLFKLMHCGKAIYNPDEDDGVQGPEGYLPEFGDNTGNNISRLNKHFCELTAMYWAWKNDKDSDYLGLNHYRRYFASNNDDRSFITKDEIIETLKSYDFIVTGASSDYIEPNQPGNGVYYGFKYCHTSRAYDIALRVCKKMYPKMYSDFNRESVYNPAMCVCNVLICKRELFMEYCEWLFPLLFEIHNQLDYEREFYDSYSRRMVGFLSERLLRVYLSVKKYTYKDQHMVE